MVTLSTPHLGYTRGRLTGNMDGFRYEVQIGSGYLIYLYDDEFERD